MDAGNIFVYVLSVAFFGVIVYLAALSRRHSAEAEKAEEPRSKKAA